MLLKNGFDMKKTLLYFGIKFGEEPFMTCLGLETQSLGLGTKRERRAEKGKSEKKMLLLMLML